jgi:hypothetical protein
MGKEDFNRWPRCQACSRIAVDEPAFPWPNFTSSARNRGVILSAPFEGVEASVQSEYGSGCERRVRA